MKIYIERRIESEKDLPKKDGKYIVHNKLNSNIVRYYYHFNDLCKNGWLNKVDWYLEPIEVSDKDISEWADKEDWGYGNTYIDMKKGAIIGAKAALNGEIKKEQ